MSRSKAGKSRDPKSGMDEEFQLSTLNNHGENGDTADVMTEEDEIPQRNSSKKTRIVLSREKSNDSAF